VDEKTFRLLQQADWSLVRRKLLTYATWRARHYWWPRGNGLDLAEGTTVEDVAHEVMVKVLEGIRRWDPARGELFPWLQAQSNSIIDALAKSAPHRHEVGLLEAEALTVMPSSDPLEIVIDEETKTQRLQRVNALLRMVETEPELREVLEVILDGCEPKPRHLAVKLGVPIADINNRLKRLRRHALSPLLRRVL
jgi:DNA-directed RNA polymerase specialized sigma24 family protein